MQNFTSGTFYFIIRILKIETSGLFKRITVYIIYIEHLLSFWSHAKCLRTLPTHSKRICKNLILKNNFMKLEIRI